jgi:polyisoprenyl-phosphate glycosyltransferase
VTDLPQISIVIPLYNESEIFATLIGRLNQVILSSPFTLEVVLVDDGSRDSTPQLMQAVALQDEHYVCLFLSRNHGHQLALTAGLAVATASEAVMIMDGDLQDPPELLTDFYARFQEGYDVVYAVRKKRKEGFIKKTAYHLFYRLLKSISYIDLPLDSGDFSLLSRKVVDILNRMPEESRFIRGMRSWVGFRQIGIEYDRQERMQGYSKYTFRMLFRLAYNGIFNFSEFPVKLITRLGIGSVVLSVIYLGYTLVKRFLYGSTPEGFTALLFVIVLFGGGQFIAIGVLGEYIIRIFFQVKGRPLYTVRQVIRDKKIVD